MLVVVLAMPAFGQSFPDVPRNHWAYEAINKLVAAGVIEGFTDGEYKGQQSMTRYEMAVLISRALDNIIAEQEAMAAEMEAMGEGLTTDQAEDVTAIVRSLMEKNTQDTLSDSQAQEVADIVDALTFELRAELRVLGADVDALYEDMDALEAKVDALDIPEDNIEWAADVSAIFEASDYGDNEMATAELWADEDLLDLEDDFAEGVYADFPSEKNFYQEYNFIVNGDISGAEFNLNIDALSTYFADAHGEVFGDTSQTGLNPVSDSGAFKIDSALLEVAYNGTNVKVGNMDDYHVERYFADEIGDARGVEATTSYMGFDFKGLILGEGDEDTDDYYGLTMSRDLDSGAVECLEIADNVVLGGEVVYDYEMEDFLAAADAAVTVTDEVTIKGKVEYAGTDFRATGDDQGDNDLEESDGNYILANVGAEYLLNDTTTLLGGYTFVTRDDANADKHRINAGIENTYGDFDNYANVEYTMNDSYEEDYNMLFVEADTTFDLDDRTSLIGALEYQDADDNPNEDTYTLAKIGAAYDWTATTTIGAAYQYKNIDGGLNYTI
jgi:polyhydroxyalkanoate synthesis regulator phasin